MRCIVDHIVDVRLVASCVRDPIINQCNQAKRWLKERSQQQDLVPGWVEHVLWSHEIRKKTMALDTACRGVLEAKMDNQQTQHEEDDLLDDDKVDEIDEEDISVAESSELTEALSGNEDADNVEDK